MRYGLSGEHKTILNTTEYSKMISEKITTLYELKGKVLKMSAEEIEMENNLAVLQKKLASIQKDRLKKIDEIEKELYKVQYPNVELMKQELESFSIGETRMYDSDFSWKMFQLCDEEYHRAPEMRQLSCKEARCPNEVWYDCYDCRKTHYEGNFSYTYTDLPTKLQVGNFRLAVARSPENIHMNGVTDGVFYSCTITRYFFV